MKKTIYPLLIVAIGMLLILGFSMSANAQTVVQSESQAKLMAKRAAQEDAYRNLAETIYGVRLDSKTTVKDFVTQDDKIQSRLRAFLRGAQVVGVDYLPDGTCKVEVEVKVAALQRVLRRQFAYYGDSITATGYGVPNPVAATPEPTPPPVPPEEDWTTLIIKATGSGVAPEDMKGMPQGKLMAERAAYADAMRNLGENIKGVHIKSETEVKNFVTQDDKIRTKFEAFLKGAKKVETRELEDGTVEVDVEIPLKGLPDVLATKPAQEPPTPTEQ
jgi:hypothetical protein